MASTFSVDFRTHMMTVSIKPPEPIISCDYCDYTVTNADACNMKRHIEAMHLKSTPLLCEECGFCCYRKDYLSNHIKTHHSGQEKPSRRRKKDANADPNNPAVAKPAKVHKCQYCDRAFPTYPNKKRHEENVHLKLMKYRCTACTYKASKNEYLRNHMLKAHNLVLEKNAYLKQQQKQKAERLRLKELEKARKKEEKEREKSEMGLAPVIKFSEMQQSHQQQQQQQQQQTITFNL